MGYRDKEKQREWQRQWRAVPGNREKRNQRQREWAAKPENREKRRQYRKNRAERDRELARRYRLANRDKIEAQRRARYAANGGALARHRMDAADWSRMWESQDGRCYLCGGELLPEDAVIEHDHRCCPEFASCSKCRRGLAHKRCNALIGLADDDPSRLRLIADNLDAARAAIDIRLAQEPQQPSCDDGNAA